MPQLHTSRGAVAAGAEDDEVRDRGGGSRGAAKRMVKPETWGGAVSWARGEGEGALFFHFFTRKRVRWGQRE